METIETAIVEVLLENGVVVSKRATPKRNYTYALVTDTEVISWHTDQVAAFRAHYRKARHIDDSVRIVRTRLA